MNKRIWIIYITYTKKFAPTHAGTKNREFSEVKADGSIYCYSDPNMDKFVNQRDKNGNLMDIGAKKYLIQLVDDTHLKVESQLGTTCGTNEIFKNPLTYER